VLGLIGFWVFGYEPKGRSFEEIDRALDDPDARRSPVPVRAV
jgi:hypothetical protein